MNKSTKTIFGVVIILGILVVCGFLFGFGLLGEEVLYSVKSSFSSAVQYYITVSELMNDKDAMLNKQVRISGAIIGESIEFDESNQTLSFLIADVPADYKQVEQHGGIAAVLENAVNDPSLQRIEIIYTGEKPELLRNMAQAIMVGELHSNGIFYADEILLRCPSRYEEAVPAQVVN